MKFPEYLSLILGLFNSVSGILEFNYGFSGGAL